MIGSVLNFFKRRWRRFRYVIHLDGDPYLIRYRLFRCRWFGIYLHHILRSDTDREPHDHPWHFTTIILWGGYHEYTLCCPVRVDMNGWLPNEFQDKPQLDEGKMTWRGVGSIIRHRAWDLHRLEMPYGKSAWTLFITGHKFRAFGQPDTWGFQTAEGWIGHKEYHKMKGYDSDGYSE